MLHEVITGAQIVLDHERAVQPLPHVVPLADDPGLVPLAERPGHVRARRMERVVRSRGGDRVLSVRVSGVVQDLSYNFV